MKINPRNRNWYDDRFVSNTTTESILPICFFSSNARKSRGTRLLIKYFEKYSNYFWIGKLQRSKKKVWKWGLGPGRDNMFIPHTAYCSILGFFTYNTLFQFPLMFYVSDIYNFEVWMHRSISESDFFLFWIILTF
jgi:hypothetical protein